MKQLIIVCFLTAMQCGLAQEKPRPINAVSYQRCVYRCKSLFVLPTGVSSQAQEMVRMNKCIQKCYNSGLLNPR